jgi:hypothetical protein
MAIITKEILKSAVEMIEDMLADYHDKIDKTYNATDGALSIGLKVKLAPIEGGKLEILTNIDFIESRVKDQQVRHVDPKQKSLFDERDDAGVHGTH